MKYSDITCERRGATTIIAVNRPDRLNAYRNETVDELRDAITSAGLDPEMRCILLTGAGRAFGSGYDLASIDPSRPPELDRVLAQHFNPLVAAMRQSRLPVVAAVNGPCAGAAVGIALAADIVVAGRSAYFYEPFVGIALVPDAGNTMFLTRILGRIRASGMMLLGERIDAERAERWGLVWNVFDDDALIAGATAICERLSGFGPDAMASTKQLISMIADSGLDDHLAMERDLQGAAGRSPAVAQHIAAFLGNRR